MFQNSSITGMAMLKCILKKVHNYEDQVVSLDFIPAVHIWSISHNIIISSLTNNQIVFTRSGINHLICYSDTLLYNVYSLYYCNMGNPGVEY